MKYLINKTNIIFILLFFILFLSYLNLEKANNNFDEKIRDILFSIRGEIKTTNQVTIIDIDEKSINTLGQWPFGRNHMAQVLANLTNANAGIIGLDIIFSEDDRSSPSFMAQTLGVEGKYTNNDELLASIISQTPTIVGYYFTKENSKNSLPKTISQFEPKDSTHVISFDNVVTNISSIQNSAYSSGFFNAFNDYDGKITKMPLILKFKDKIYTSLVFEMINIASNSPKINIIEDNYAIHGLKLENLEIPTDKNGFMRINFRGAKKSFKYISFIDILNGNFDKKDIENRFILIGSSITTLADLRATTYDLAMPGVEIHANMIDNILKGDFIYKAPFSKIIDIFVIFFIVIILSFILLKLSSFYSIILVSFISVLLYYLYYYLLFSHGIILNLLYPFLSIIFTTIISLYLKYQKEQKQKEFIKDKFAKKVSLGVANDLLSISDDSFKVKEKELTIFFSDIRDFTKLSERFESPQELITLLNRYLEPMSETIANNLGTIDKFIGDAIMAYWNAPNDLKNHANIALDSALIQLDKLKELNKILLKDCKIELDIGIGIHTGIAVVGEMGSKGRSDYTIIGDNVNLASRVEGLTKYFGVKLIITEFTKEKLTKDYHIKYLASVVVKGKTNAIKLYEVMNEKDYDEFKAFEKDYFEAISFYKNRELEKSKELFLKMNSKKFYEINQLYINRCNQFIKNEEPFSFEFIMNHK